ncbi:MAG TPA: PIG-L family deacetylase [bacterium]|nr:PIG-L family deacetylase [bacterium]HNZ73436.1 PIG-L family deacetylase [bacterium]HOH66878.1 PIG-L family deacetylase [bacterium]HPN81313.1 PIG-L family deacetylase [bacterium]HPW39566.1 PIG-L family deacetylase [bacterium]
MEEQEIIGKNILLIIPHPDDETFIAGGTIYKNQRLGGKTSIVCASLGERGTLYLPHKMTKKELMNARKKEIEMVAKYLKVNNLFTFKFPDGELNLYKKEIFNRALKIADKLNPDLIISFDKFGLSGHRDHIAISKISKKICRKLKISFYTATISPKISPRFGEVVKNRKRGNHYKKKIKYSKPDVKIKINPDVKLKAFSFYKTQGADKDTFRGMPESFEKEILKAEYFTKQI